MIRHLGSDMYGVWVLILAVLGVAMLAEGGLATSVTFFAAKNVAQADSRGLSQTITAALATTFLLAAVMSAAVYCGANLIVGFFDKLSPAHQTAAATAIRFGVASLAALLIQNVLIGLLHGMQRYGVSNALSTIQVAANTIGFIVISAKSGSVVHLMIWQVIVSVSSVLLYAFVVRYLLRSFRIRPEFDRGQVVAVWRYGAMTWIGALGGVLFSQLDRLVVAKALGAPTLAIYGAITGAVKQINTFTAVPVQPLLPQLAQLSGRHEAADEIRSLVRKAMHVNTLGALGMGVVLFTLAPIAMSILLDRIAVQGEVTAFRIATVIYSLFSINGVGYYVLLAMNGVRSFMIIQLLSGVAALVFIALGANLGLLGAIVGNAGYLGVWAFSLLGMRQVNVDLRTWISWIQPALVWAAVTAAITLVIPQSTLVLVVAALIQSGVLALWFVREQPTLFYSLAQLRHR